MRASLVCGALALSLMVGCAERAPVRPNNRSSDTRGGRMMVVDQLGVSLTLASPRIWAAADLECHVVFKNLSAAPLRLNALKLDFATILFKIKREDETPVPPGSPPMPPIDDGETARIMMAPGQEVTFDYDGSSIFGVPLEPGKYQIRFVYRSTAPKGGDWAGIVETDWVGFEVVPRYR